MLNRVGMGNHCHTIPCTVNIRHEIIFVANRLTCNLPANENSNLLHLYFMFLYLSPLFNLCKNMLM